MVNEVNSEGHVSLNKWSKKLKVINAKNLNITNKSCKRLFRVMKYSNLNTLTQQIGLSR